MLLPGPGNYYLEIEAGDVRYELAIDARERDLPPQPDGPGNDPRAPGNEEVRNIPNKNLPNTGGLAILAPAIGLYLISGAATGLLVRSWRAAPTCSSTSISMIACESPGGPP